MTRMLLVVSFSVALLAACSNEDDEQTTTSTNTISNASATPTDAATSGIEGQVLLGPTCPVEREGMPCEEPYEATIVVWDAARTTRVLLSIPTTTVVFGWAFRRASITSNRRGSSRDCRARSRKA